MKKSILLGVPVLIFTYAQSLFAVSFGNPVTLSSSKSDTVGTLATNITVFLIIWGIIIGVVYFGYRFWKKSSSIIIYKTNPKKDDVEISAQGTQDTKVLHSQESSIGKFVTFLAFLGLIGSFFIPILVLDNESSFSLFQLLTSEDTPTKISNTLFSFMGQSFFAGVSILMAHIGRKKLISLVGLFGIFFYIRALLSLSSHSENTLNIFRILQNLGMGAEQVTKLILSSPGFIIYTIASFFLILACFSIIFGYIQMYQEKTKSASIL